MLKRDENSPFGETVVSAAQFAPVVNVVVNSQMTIITVGTMSAPMTLNAQIASTVKPNAHLLVKLTSDANAHDVTLGQGFVGGIIQGTATKTKYAKFVFDGSAFIHLETDVLN